MRELFENAGFRRLWSALMVLSLGDALMQMGLLEVFRRHGYNEQTETAKMLFAVALPGLLLGPLAMAYLDRWQRRNVLLVSDAFRALVAVGIVIWLWPLETGRVEQRHLWVVYSLIFVIGTVATFYLPARAALVPNLVPIEKLVLANTVFTSSIAIAAIGGRALGGFVAEVFGPMAGVGANVLAYIASVWWLWRIKLPPHATTRDGGATHSGWVELRSGTEYIWGHTIAFRLVCISGVFAMIGGLLLVELVGYAVETLHLRTGGVGYLIGAGGAGAALGLAACGRNRPWTRSDLLPAVSLAVVGLALVAMGATTRIWAAVLCVVFIGMAGAIVAIHIEAKLQQHVEETRRGAVFAARGMLTSLTTVVAFWLQFGTRFFQETETPAVLHWCGLAAVIMALIAAVSSAQSHRQRRS